MELWFLPPFHASLNAAAAVVLAVGLVAIKLGMVRLHRGSMLTALALSALFLLSYVIYHFTTGETRYGDANGDGILQAEEEAEEEAPEPTTETDADDEPSKKRGKRTVP